jgi:ABC-type phosphate/phosphonate transport system substrate-binding protein
MMAADEDILVSSTLKPELKQRLRAAFLSTEQDQQTRQTLKQFGLSRFVAADPEDYSLDAHADLAALLSAR